MYCFRVPGVIQDLSGAESIYRDYFKSTSGQKPVCLMQKGNDPNVVHISEVLVDPNKQEMFLEAIRLGDAPLLPQNFREVRCSETLPVRSFLHE